MVPAKPLQPVAAVPVKSESAEAGAPVSGEPGEEVSPVLNEPAVASAPKGWSKFIAGLGAGFGLFAVLAFFALKKSNRKKGNFLRL
jgi:hypothetical protein